MSFNAWKYIIMIKKFRLNDAYSIIFIYLFTYLFIYLFISIILYSKFTIKNKADTIVFTIMNRYAAKYMLIYVSCLRINFINKKI